MAQNESSAEVIIQMTPTEEYYDNVHMIRVFEKEVHGKNYTKEETAAAFKWFSIAWKVKRDSIPDKKVYEHGRSFFQGEGQEEANNKVDGWNACRSEMLK